MNYFLRSLLACGVVIGSICGQAAAEDKSADDKIPVLFVDQMGHGKENPKKGQLGATYFLRTILRVSDTESKIEIRHITLAQLDERQLKGVPLVVISGVADPKPVVPLLRKFIEQKGQLLIAAGSEFDPVLWNKSAWLGGKGILPAPLKPKVLGKNLDRPRAKDEPLTAFNLDFDSLREQEYFQLPSVSETSMRDIITEPHFFRAIQTDLTGEPSEKQSKPKVLARFDTKDNVPYLVERKVGKGNVLFVASGFDASTSTIRTSIAMIVFDRIMRQMAGLPSVAKKKPSSP